ncbi:MAG TPA: response regulator transcription factor [Rhizomicrobium sp.]|nr:response regulator transcription factor [Rhizomicrobium sp.]
MGKTLIVVEDDPAIRALLATCLTQDGHIVIALATGAELEETLSANGADLVIIDLGLPDTDGLTLTRHIREMFDIGIIIVSGRRDLMDRIIGLEIGADDYITKPFEPREVIARVHSVLRRGVHINAASAVGSRHKRLAFGGWTIDLTSQILLAPNGTEVALTSGEFKLLETFVSHANRVLSREQLLDMIYHNGAPAFDRSIDVRIGRLRKKLDNESAATRFIKTIRNSGYMFTAKVVPA